MSYTREHAVHYREDFLRILEEIRGGTAVDVAWRYAREKPCYVYSAAEVEFLLSNDPGVEWTGKKYEVKR